ncbi:MAG: hypothetical protein ACYSUK_11875 [Planctomycetota bacterium]|jgi:peptidoglycan hydrolase CwlO-like protein
MKQTVLKMLLILVWLFILVAGCEEQQANVEVPGEKQARLVAIENTQLKEQIQQFNQKLANQKRSYEKQIRGLKAVINQAKETNNELRELLKEDANWQQMEEFMSTLAATIGEKNDRLTLENRSLKDEIEELKNKIEELEGSGE